MYPNINQYMKMKYGKLPEGKCSCPKVEGELDHVAIGKALGASSGVCGKCNKLIYSEEDNVNDRS